MSKRTVNIKNYVKQALERCDDRSDIIRPTYDLNNMNLTQKWLGERFGDESFIIHIPILVDKNGRRWRVDQLIQDYTQDLRSKLRVAEWVGSNKGG